MRVLPHAGMRVLPQVGTSALPLARNLPFQGRQQAPFSGEADTTGKHAYLELRKKGGTLQAKNVNKMVMEVLEVTGFTRLIEII